MSKHDYNVVWTRSKPWGVIRTQLVSAESEQLAKLESMRTASLEQLHDWQAGSVVLRATLVRGEAPRARR